MNQKVIYDNRRAQQLRKLGDAFSTQSRFTAALDRLSMDPRKLTKAIADPKAFLRRSHLRLPEGLAFEIFEVPPRFFPFPDWVPWLIELTSCRKFYRWECDEVPKPDGLRPCHIVEVEVCFGFRIYPQPWPRGPFSL